MFIQWMADLPTADSASKFINKLTGASCLRVVIVAVQVYHGMNFFFHVINSGSMTFVSGLQLSLTIIYLVETWIG